MATNFSVKIDEIATFIRLWWSGDIVYKFGESLSNNSGV